MSKRRTAETECRFAGMVVSQPGLVFVHACCGSGGDLYSEVSPVLGWNVYARGREFAHARPMVLQDGCLVEVPPAVGNILEATDHQAIAASVQRQQDADAARRRLESGPPVVLPSRGSR